MFFIIKGYYLLFIYYAEAAYAYKINIKQKYKQNTKRHNARIYGIQARIKLCSLSSDESTKCFYT